MYIGKVLVKDQSAYTPWIARQADNAVFTWEKIQEIAGTSVDVTVYTKKKEDSGPGALYSMSWSSSGSFRYATFKALDEMIRFKIAASGGLAGGVVRILPATWFNDIKP